MEREGLMTKRRGVEMQTYFARIYNYMAGGLLLSALMAWLSVKEPLVSLFYQQMPEGVITFSVLGWIALFAPLIVVFLIGNATSKLNVQQAQLWFWLFSALMGISLGNIFFLYSNAAIFQAFIVTAAMFLGLSWIGAKTERDLSGLGHFLLMGLIGVVVASLINLFMHSGMMNFVLNVLSVLIFVGLTAYDTNRLKAMYMASDSEDMMRVKAIQGALALYLDFINLFRLMLYFLNNRR